MFLRKLGRVIVFSPGLASIIGRNEALLLAQFLYWTERTDDSEGWIYKNSSDIEEETSLTYKEQLTARKNLATLGVLQEDPKRLEHTIYFRVDQDSLDVLIDRQLEVGHLPSRNTSTFPKGSPPSSLKVDPYKEQENTSEITDNKITGNSLSKKCHKCGEEYLTGKHDCPGKPRKSNKPRPFQTLQPASGNQTPRRGFVDFDTEREEHNARVIADALERRRVGNVKRT